MFTEERIGEIVRQLDVLRVPDREPQKHWTMRKTAGEERPSPAVPDGEWSDIPAGAVWGGHMEYYCFRGTVTVPERFAGKIVEFVLRTGKEGEWDATNPQFTAYVDGKIRHGLDVNHRTVRLSEEAKAGKNYDIFLSAFTGTQNFHLCFDASLQTVDPAVTELYYDLMTPWQTVCLLHQESREYLELLPVLEKSVNALDLRKPGSEAFYRSVEAADRILKESLYTEVRKTEAEAACVGHTHIDVAWLWTLAVTRDKSVRSFSTVLELMKRYPEYLFMSSQPQLYAYVKENAPEVYAEIKKRVAEGRWEPEGGMWLEPDCNLASGEAFVRQFLLGKRFFKEEFGVDNEILWLPDVFGYSAALPQIMKKCGIKYFMTTKIGWNELNKMPYDTFYWKGIDGTEILSHFGCVRDYEAPGRTHPTSTEHYSPFSTTYNGLVNPSQLKGTWQRYQQKNLNNEVLFTYGYGDGGGGPTEEMLEVQRRLAYGIPGCPKTKQSKAIDFFRRLEKDTAEKKVPVWTGELYLEYHRGTYTTMARNKKYNRRSEFALTGLESESLLAEKFCGIPYPKQELYDNWIVLLRNQFHDILPGSAIKEAYEDSKEEYEKLLSFAEREGKLRRDGIADKAGKTIVFNRNGQTVSGLVKIQHAEGRKYAQRLPDGSALVWADNVPSKGFCVLKDIAPPVFGDHSAYTASAVSGAPALTASTVSTEVAYTGLHANTGVELNPDTDKPVQFPAFSIAPEHIETPFARLELNSRGQIVSWVDKTAGREILQTGKKANVLTAYEDKPHNFDNWNLYDYYREKAWEVDELLEARVTESGPYRGALELKWRYEDSVIEETVYAYSFSPRIDFVFRTDWHENQTLLKTLFPVELNTSEATYEIQFGNVKRSTAVNTSWDAARFEVCHHKWMDLSEGGYGVSFMNDCKFGVSVDHNEVGLSLLRCGTYPNPEADREYHEAVYSVLPHCGTWQDAGTVREAYLLNNPLLVAEPEQNDNTAYACAVEEERCGGTAGAGERLVSGHSNGRTAAEYREESPVPESYSLAQTNRDNLMIESVKQAEDGSAVILRLYEFTNTRTDAVVTLPEKAKEIWLCDMLEQKQQLIAENTDSIRIHASPFEIISLRLE